MPSANRDNFTLPFWFAKANICPKMFPFFPLIALARISCTVLDKSPETLSLVPCLKGKAFKLLPVCVLVVGSSYTLLCCDRYLPEPFY